MKKTTALIMMLTVSLLLTACGSDDSTPEALTKHFMDNAKNKIAVDFRRRFHNEDIPYIKRSESDEEWMARFVTGFNFEKLNRHDYIIHRHLADHYEDDYESLTIDIGKANIDGSRATVSAYVASNECRFSYSHVEDKWRLSDIVCSEYQY